MSAPVSAQNAVQWKGHDYSTLLSGNGTTVLLYNVGTGRFLIHGGDWGTQSRLFYSDTGKTLTLRYGNGSNNIIFATGMETEGRAALGCNIPQVSSAQAWGNGDECYTVLMDGQERIQYGNVKGTYRNWHFTRVPEYDENGNELKDVYTYYLYENFGTQSTKYNKENSGSGTARNADYSGVYMGAAYGENWNNQDGDPNGPLVLLSSSFDKVTWSTVAPTSTTKWNCGVKSAVAEGLDEETTTVQRSMADEVPIFNSDTKVELKKLYQWRIVTLQDIENAMTSTDVNAGNSTNLTHLIDDRGFERNDWSFYNSWQTARFSSGVTYNNNQGRYKYTWGFISGDQSSASKTQHHEDWNWWETDPNQVRGPWNIPLRLKSQYDSKGDAKYGFLEFEGVGTAYTSVTAPKAGVYKITAYGFYQSSNSSDDHKGYLFATTTAPTTNNGITYMTNSFPTGQKTYFDSKSGLSKGTAGGVKNAGADFAPAKANYLVEVEVKTTSDNQTIYFGVGKNAATQTTGSESYYYDSDWVCADQFQIYYMGSENAKLFDEDKTGPFEATDYMGTEQYTNRTIRLHRKFQTGKWNSFVFPLNLTAQNVRTAFGDGTRVAELKGIGVTEWSNNANIIDFASISLGAEDNAIEAGKLYLIMPQNEPTPGITSTGGKDYYTLGAASFSGTALDAVTMNQDVYKPAAGSANAEGHNNIKIDGTFFSSLDYEDTSLGNKNPDTRGAYVPAGSYVFGMKNGVYTVYHTKNDLKTKGFRAWIVDVEAQQAKAYKMAINGVCDDTTDIEDIFGETVVITDSSAIYDLSGRRVAASADKLNALPKGMYIVNGKKYVVK